MSETKRRRVGRLAFHQKLSAVRSQQISGKLEIECVLFRLTFRSLIARGEKPALLASQQATAKSIVGEAGILSDIFCLQPSRVVE